MDKYYIVPYQNIIEYAHNVPNMICDNEWILNLCTLNFLQLNIISYQVF